MGFEPIEIDIEKLKALNIEKQKVICFMQRDENNGGWGCNYQVWIEQIESEFKNQLLTIEERILNGYYTSIR